MTEDLNQGWDEKLSYSSWSLFSACKRKYLLKKIKKVPIDVDAEEDTHAFRFGKALHEILQNCQHQVAGLTKSIICDTALKYDLDPVADAAHLFAMCRHYKLLRAKTGLTAIECELKLSTPKMLAFLDVILVDSESNWWIGDIKTSAMFNDLTKARLHRDWQLNLYARHAQEVGLTLNLDPKKFQGCRYIVLSKSRLSHKTGESFADFAKRLEKSVTATEVIIPKKDLDAEDIYKQFLNAHAEICRIWAMKESLALRAAPKNPSCCTQYFKSCEFWSQCYGKTFTESKNPEIITSEG